MVFRELSPKEEGEFRHWARSHWQEGEEVLGIWHPVVRDEITKMQAEYALIKRSMAARPPMGHDDETAEKKAP